jgi:hypothetical protein
MNKCSIIFPGEKDVQEGNNFVIFISIVNSISYDWLFMCLMNCSKLSFPCGQIKLVSSTNHLQCFGFNGEVLMAISSKYSMKMFATNGESDYPIATSFVCSYISPQKMKYVDFRHPSTSFVVSYSASLLITIMTSFTRIFVYGNTTSKLTKISASFTFVDFIFYIKCEESWMND